MKFKNNLLINNGMVVIIAKQRKWKWRQSITKIHEELSKKYGVDKLTAAQGLECGKMPLLIKLLSF
jgi:hypothetical protein